MNITKDTIEKYNQEIAKMLGWFQKEGHNKNIWFIKDRMGIYVISHNGLNFHCNLCALIDVLIHIENLGFFTSIIYNKNGHEIIIEKNYEIIAHKKLKTITSKFHGISNNKISILYSTIGDFAEKYNSELNK